MAEETISTAILTVATIIAAVVLLNAIYPSLYSASGSILSMDSATVDRMNTDLKVLTEFPSADSDGHFQVTAWVKNTGSTSIRHSDLDLTDVYLYPGSGVATRFSLAGGAPNWQYGILSGDGDSDWDPGETLQVTLHYGSALPSGTARLRLALYNGVFAEDTFSW